MKTETIVKYLQFLRDLAYSISKQHPEEEQLGQLQTEHNLFLKRLREDSMIDKGFLYELENLDLGAPAEIAEGTSVFRMAIGKAIFGKIGSFGQKINSEVIRQRMDEYFHRIDEIARKYSFGPKAD